MPNILKLQKELESIPDERLIAEVSAPNMYPAYLSAPWTKGPKTSSKMYIVLSMLILTYIYISFI